MYLSLVPNLVSLGSYLQLAIILRENDYDVKSESNKISEAVECVIHRPTPKLERSKVNPRT